jgi:hypothetical protein
MKKKCTKCREEKELIIENFPPRKDTKDGFRSECRECRKLRNREAYGPTYKKKNQAGHRRRKYGITTEKYNTVLDKQKGVCAICGTKEKRSIRGAEPELSVDHDHKTGEIRGLLCHRCNSGLGLFQEDLRILRRAVRYLKERKWVV